MIDFTKTNTVDGPRPTRWMAEIIKEARRRKQAAKQAKTPVKAQDDHAITSDLDQIAARLNAFGAELQRPVAGMKAATRAVVGVLKKHFRTKNQVLN